MADEVKALFTIDISEILAKKHLGGLMTVKSENVDHEFIINTGIKNDDQKATPDNPGKVKFDMDNAQLQYEIGFVTQTDVYQITVNLINQIHDIQDKFDKYIQAEASKKDASGKSLTAPDVDVKKQQKKDQADESFESLFKKVEIKDSTGKVIEEKDPLDMIASLNSKMSALIDKFRKNLELYNKIPASDVKKLEEKKKILDEWKNKIATGIKDALKNDDLSGAKGNSELETKYNQVIEAAQKNAFEQLQAYISVFMSKKQGAALKIDDLVKIELANDIKGFDDKRLVKDYMIMSATDKEIEVRNAKFKANPTKCQKILCYKVGYTLDVEK